MKPLLTLIIPTKNRYSTLFPLVETLLSYNLKEFEIVIQDNSDSNEKAISFFKNLHNKEGLKYFYNPDKLSVIENSDLAVKNASGEYVCFIGDDDGVMPYVIDLTKWMKAEHIEVIKGYTPDYTWPGLKSSYLESNTTGILKFKKFNYNITTINTEKALKKNLSKGGTYITELPCLYEGIVSRQLLDKIYKKTNSYFPGPSPDMSNAVALSVFVKEFVFLNFPIVISGKSIKSTGGQGNLHKHVARIEDLTHLPNNTKEVWSKEIPKFWTGSTIWAESVVKSLEACGKQEYKELNYSYLYAKIMIFNFSNRKQIFENFQQKVYTSKFAFSFMAQLMNRIVLFFLRKVDITVISMSPVQDIGKAVENVNNHINYEKLPFSNLKNQIS